jgi:Arc/MetJ family transcription regulator
VSSSAEGVPIIVGENATRFIHDAVYLALHLGRIFAIHMEVVEYTHRTRRCKIRTNVVIDDELMAAALEYTGLKTKKAVIEEGLGTLARLKKQERVRSLRGKLQWTGDLTLLREGRFSDVDR